MPTMPAVGSRVGGWRRARYANPVRGNTRRRARAVRVRAPGATGGRGRRLAQCFFGQRVLARGTTGAAAQGATGAVVRRRRLQATCGPTANQRRHSHADAQPCGSRARRCGRWRAGPVAAHAGARETCRSRRRYERVGAASGGTSGRSSRRGRRWIWATHAAWPAAARL